MTTLWKITPDWQGQTVAVLATGPSLTPALVAALCQYRTIAVNEAVRLAPEADMLVALDGNWPPAYRNFAGQRVTGVADDSLDALYAGPFWCTVRLTNGAMVEMRNSGLAAIKIAAAMGAARIILAGFDHPERSHHFYDDEVDTGEYTGLPEGVADLVAQLAAQGVQVERAAPVAEAPALAATAPAAAPKAAVKAGKVGNGGVRV